MSRFSNKKSKRVSCKTRYKIQKKVKEHHKKEKKAAKKEAKNNPRKGINSGRKDPGVPNSLPFKEEILKEAESRRQRAEDSKLRQKEERKKSHDKNRPGLEEFQKQALKKTKEFEKKNESKIEKDPGSDAPRTKAYYKEFRKIVESADVVLEVLDARDPLGSRCLQVEEAVIAAGTNKKLILVLNKIDLVPKENLLLWLKYLRNEFPTIPFKASTQTQQDHLSRSRVAPQHSTENLLKSSLCIGAGALMKILGNYCRNQNIRTTITVGVVGFPNVGKSSIINSLKRSKACAVGGTPGVTKFLQEVLLDSHIKLIDSPGVVLAKGTSEASAALRNALKLEAVKDPLLPIEAILARANKEQLMLHYRLANFSSTSEFLSLLAMRLGKLKKGGVPDVLAAARKILHDWNTGCIKYYTHPPETHEMPSHLSAEIVSEMGKPFDINSLFEDEGKEVANVSVMVPSNAVVVTTEGIMDADETSKIEEEEEAVQEPMETDKKEMTLSFTSKKKSTENKGKKDGLEDLQMNRKMKRAFKKKQRKKRKNENRINRVADETGSSLPKQTTESYSFDADFE